MLRLFRMVFSHDKRDTVEHLAIESFLTGQSCQRVTRAFDFEPVKFAVHHRDIDPNRARPNTHFLHNQRAIVAEVLFIEFAAKGRSHVEVSHHTLFWNGRVPWRLR
ncbi:hypothetical protein JQ629_23595 [Bradyrhizobium sp. AUGA SZCCT0222]|uniref:hypothetical protein n=1 Tax=Bradyrhizobium sp. AUGA SZCCT0222 TaxID=2807668 RepID=UPI001BABC715|nr:hypothetical protein [Bradyrhizobium sp. AUGA SZCCT0222]MBR1270463.1 hypothetical protein [Bradyrhizobium sp. AUGA SZCCT0222]